MLARLERLKIVGLSPDRDTHSVAPEASVRSSDALRNPGTSGAGVSIRDADHGAHRLDLDLVTPGGVSVRAAHGGL